MKKMNAWMRICAMVLAVMLVAVQIPVMASETASSLTFDQFAKQVAANGGNAVDHKGIVEFHCLYGSFANKELKPFPYTNDAKNILVDAEGASYASAANAFDAWRWKASLAAETVLKITAKQDVKLNFADPDGLLHPWCVASHFLFVVENAAGEQKQVGELKLTGNNDVPMPTEDTAFEIHLAAGQILYLVYGKTEGGTTDAMQCEYYANLDMDTAAYDASKNAFYNGAVTPDNPPATPDVTYSNEPFDWLVKHVARNEGGVIDHKGLVSYTFLYGDFDANTLKPFTSFAASGDAMYNDDYSAWDNGLMNGMRAWEWRACAANDTVLKFTATVNVRLDLSAACAAGSAWATNSNFRFVWENAEGERVLVTSLKMENREISQEAGSFNFHLAAGDSLYVVYGVFEAGPIDPVTSGWNCAMEVNYNAYDETKRPVVGQEPVDPPEGDPEPEDPDYAELDFSDLVTDTWNTQGGAVEKLMADFHFLYGDFDNNGEMKSFGKFLGAGDGGWQDACYDEASSSLDNCLNGLWRWQWRCSAGADTILKITAKKDMAITLYQRQDEPNQWADFSAYRFFVEDDQGRRIMVKRTDVPNGTLTMDSIRLTVHLKEGDTLYVVYGIMDNNPSTATSSYYPLLTLDAKGYDAAQRPAFDQLDAINALKAEKLAALETKMQELLGDGTIYSVSRRLEMEDLVETAGEKLMELASAEEIEALYAKTVEDMEAILTIAEEKAEMDAFKQQKKAALSEKYKEELYSKKNYEQVKAQLEALFAEIDEAESAGKINSLIAKAEIALKAIPQGGAGGTGGGNTGLIIGIAAAAILAIAAVVVFILKKNRKH